MPEALNVRRAGVLLHISSLPNEFGLGDFGSAYKFIDYLVTTGISVWQVLPLGPTHHDLSPYLCTSSLAGNAMFIDLDKLRDCGWLSKTLSVDNFSNVAEYRSACLKNSFEGFKANANKEIHQCYQAFVETHKRWLIDFALFTSQWRLTGAWLNWPEPLRNRDKNALRDLQQKLSHDIEQVKFEQFIFYQQWLDIKAYANSNGILIFGDMPLYLAHDSAEVWSNREFFKVDSQGKADVVAGVPPDYFSSTGQIWGNPVYDWENLQQDGFRWWIERFQTQLELYDLLRIDHFRGLQAYWEIPGEADSAKAGCWQFCPGYELLQIVQETLGVFPIVAEDLGFITNEVHQLRNHFSIPGMKVMQFAFDGSPDNPYLLRHHIEHCVAYTGTHDNDTSLAWYETLPDSSRLIVDQELQAFNEAMPWKLINYTLSSPARLVMLPMQDILGLGQGYRLNTPGTINGNWLWQMQWEQLSDSLSNLIHNQLEQYQRLVICSNVNSD